MVFVHPLTLLRWTSLCLPLLPAASGAAWSTPTCPPLVTSPLGATGAWSPSTPSPHTLLSCSLPTSWTRADSAINSAALRSDHHRWYGYCTERVIVTCYESITDGIAWAEQVVQSFDSAALHTSWLRITDGPQPGAIISSDVCRLSGFYRSTLL
jgi:hypothetical protein